MESQESEKKSHITSFSEISASACADEEMKVPKINEGYVLDISGEDKATTGSKTFSDVDRKQESEIC